MRQCMTSPPPVPRVHFPWGPGPGGPGPQAPGPGPWAQGAPGPWDLGPGGPRPRAAGPGHRAPGFPGPGPSALGPDKINALKRVRGWEGTSPPLKGGVILLSLLVNGFCANY